VTTETLQEKPPICQQIYKKLQIAGIEVDLREIKKLIAMTEKPWIIEDLPNHSPVILSIWHYMQKSKLAAQVSLLTDRIHKLMIYPTYEDLLDPYLDLYSLWKLPDEELKRVFDRIIAKSYRN